LADGERLRFLNGLPRKLPPQRLAELDRSFALTNSTNSEVLFAWLKLAIENRYDPAVPAIERFLTSMGRRKFVAPLFEPGRAGRMGPADRHASLCEGAAHLPPGHQRTVDKMLAAS
jgi:hypothetical protein